MVSGEWLLLHSGGGWSVSQWLRPGFSDGAGSARQDMAGATAGLTAQFPRSSRGEETSPTINTR